MRKKNPAKKQRANGEAIDIYNFEQKLKNAYSVLERASFGEEDKELIKQVADHLRAIGVSNKRLSKYIFHLKVIGENFPTTNFKLATRKDIELFMSWLTAGIHLTDNRGLHHGLETLLQICKVRQRRLGHAVSRRGAMAQKDNKGK